MTDEDNKPMLMKVETTVLIVMVMAVALIFCSAFFYHRGHRSGTCTEMCRPAQFDSDQDVNGGCPCIGSDKVLRFKKVP